MLQSLDELEQLFASNTIEISALGQLVDEIDSEIDGL